MENNDPNDRENESTKTFIPESEGYRKIMEEYHHKSSKEFFIQLGISILSLCAVIMEILVFAFLYKLTGQVIPLEYFRNHLDIFLIIFIVLILGLIQLGFISKWNTSIDQKIRAETNVTEQNASKSSRSLTEINYNMILHLRVLMTITIIILVLCGVFYLLYVQERPLVFSESLATFYANYLALRRYSLVIITGYGILEIFQLYRWSKRVYLFNILEKRMIRELPDLFR